MRRAFSRLSRTSLPASLVVLQLDPAVGPEGDLLGEPVVDGGERLVDVGDAAVGDLLEVLGHERRGGEGDGLAAPGRRESTGRRARPSAVADRPRPAVRGRGAVPSRRTRVEPSGFTRTNCIRLESTLPSPDFTSCVSRNSSHGSVAVVGRIDENGPLAEQVGVLFEEHVGHGEHERMAGVHEHGAGQAGLVERLHGVAA